MTARCEITDLPIRECAEPCCRPDLKGFEPIPVVWLRVTEPQPDQPVTPSPSDVRTGNVHALFQVVSGRTGRPEVVDMVRELCEPSSHLVRYDLDQAEATVPVRRKKGKRLKAGRKELRPPRYHRTVEPPLMVQLYASVAPSSSAEAGAARPASSRPAARLDAIDTASRIDTWSAAWLEHLGRVAPADSIARIRRLGSLLPSLDRCGKRSPQRNEANTIICCTSHNLEADITRWWTWARVVTGWDTPAWQPDNTCPLCGIRGTLRVRLDEQRATCVNDACRETWDHFNIGLLADHIRAENNDTEEAS